MESSLLIALKSTWPTQGPYDIHACIHGVFEEEGPNPSGQGEGDNSTCQDHTLKVILTPLSQSGSSDGPCFLNFHCKSGADMVSAVILSNARHAEIHSDMDGYVRTVRGERMPKREREEVEDVVYRKEIKLNRPQTSFALKFVSLADKHHLHLHCITATLRRTGSYESATSNLPSQRSNIDMDRVRDLLSSQQQPISQRAESLMHSIEQYQRNQSLVMQDMQEAVTESTAGQKPGGGDAGMMGRMASLLSSLSRSQLSEHVAPSPEAIAKMMSSLGGAGESPVNESMYGALKVMCKDVTNLRSAERQGKKEKPCDQDDQQEERHRGGAESKPIHYVSLEDQLKPLICSMEKQIMDSLDARLESLQAHFDLRLNRLETVLSEILLHRPEKRDNDELHQVHKTLCKLPEQKETDGHEDTEIEEENSDT